MKIIIPTVFIVLGPLCLAVGGVDESYNDFWIENEGIGDTIRTSHIVYPVNGRLPSPDQHRRSWTGTSQGCWDGDGLVVVTSNFNGLSTSYGEAGTSWKKVLTERFSRVDAVTLDYELTLEDPASFSDKFTAVVSMTKVAGQLYEYA